MNKLYGLYYLPPQKVGVSSFTKLVSASNQIEKLMVTAPTANNWTTSSDPNSPNLRRYSELEDGSKFMIYEIPYIC